MKTRADRTKGLSMVEMVMVIALFSIIMLAVGESIASFYRINAYTIAQTYQVEHARRGVEQMVRDLREMIYADDGTFPLAVMEDYEVGFYSDIDRDSSVEYVEYQLASTTLMKNIYNATGTPVTYNYGSPDVSVAVSEYVQNEIQATPIFVYYDTDGIPATATTTATDIRYVEVGVIINIDYVHDPGQYMLRSSAALRNLED